MRVTQKIPGQRIFLSSLDEKSLSKDYVDWMQDSDVLKFLTGRTSPYRLEELQDYVRQMNESLEHYLLGVFLNEGNIHIGNIKIGNVGSKIQPADIGLVIGHKQRWGQGYATEAIDLASQYAFKTLQLNKLIAGMVVHNVGSLKAFLKVGFIVTGNKQVVVNGEAVDTLFLEKVRGE